MTGWERGERLLNAYCFFMGSFLFGGMMLYTVMEWLSGHVLGSHEDPDVWGGLCMLAFAYCLASPPPNRAQARWRPVYLAVLCGGLLYLATGFESDGVMLNDHARLALGLYVGVPAVTRLAQLARGVARSAS